MARWPYPVVGAMLGVVVLSPARADPAATQLGLAARPAIKLAVTSDGWFRVTESELRAAGLPAGVDAEALQLFADGVEQPMVVTGNGDATFDADDALEFHGVGRDSLWSGTRTYWLVAGARGARVPLVANPRGNPPPDSFRSVVALRERKVYYAPLRNGDASNFFGATVDGNGATQTLTVRHLVHPETATLRVTLQGVTSGSHGVTVSVGGAAVGTCALFGQEQQTCSFETPAVVEGVNAVSLVSIGAAPDISLVASLELGYDHAYVADGARLTFTAHPKTRVAVSGFPSSDVRVVDITEPGAPIELVVAPSGEAGVWTVAFDVQDGDVDRTLIAFTDAAVAAPAAIAASRPSDWMQPRAGELVILSHARFLEAAAALAGRRAAEGWSVALVDLQDVYDEFGAGDKSAFAIRDFLRGAATRWRGPPHYVLLVGDASFDPRNFTGLGDFDLAPTKLVDAHDMETSSDDWFVDQDGDGLPEVAIGRLPVRTADEARVVVAKLLGYAGRADLSRGGLFVADENDVGLDFAAATARGQASVSDLMPVERFTRGDPQATSAALLTKLGAGPFLVNYFGHGSVEVWDGLLASADAAGLGNEHPSVYVAMNCLNGFFHDLYTTSLAEALLTAPRGGAVAVWASSTLTAFEPQATLNRAFLARLTRTSLGLAALEAKGTIADGDARRTWMLFGDPTMFGTPGSWPAPGGTPPDAGAPDGGAADGGAAEDASADASRPPDAPGVDAATAGANPGCGCRAAGGGPEGAGLISLVLALAVNRRRRRVE